MAISINWDTFVINVPKADTTLVQLSPTEIRELNINDFRLILKDLEDDEAGITFPTTHSHVAPITVGGVTLARVVEILSPYTVTFEDGQYAVNLVGANSNIADKTNVNQVSVRSSNSAGLTEVNPWSFPVADNVLEGTFGEFISKILRIQKNKWKIVSNQMIIYDDDGTTPLFTFDLKDASGNPSMTSVVERIPV
jgi:hypothetical protein